MPLETNNYTIPNTVSLYASFDHFPALKPQKLSPNFQLIWMLFSTTSS